MQAQPREELEGDSELRNVTTPPIWARAEEPDDIEDDDPGEEASSPASPADPLPDDELKQEAFLVVLPFYWMGAYINRGHIFHGTATHSDLIAAGLRNGKIVRA